MAHTLLFWYRCVAALTRRSCEQVGESPRPVLLSVIAAVAAAGCFTHPINRAPVVGEIQQVGQAGRGQKATFMVTGSDPDQDQITWAWATSSGECSDPNKPSNWPRDTYPGQPGAPATYVADDATLTSGRYCVWAFATDHYGAASASNLMVDPADNAPVAAIRVVIPGQASAYSAYTSFELSADGSTDADGDSLTYAWKLTAPNGSMAIFIPCPGEDSVDDGGIVHCFKADISTQFQYVVSVSVSDGVLTSTTSLPLTVLADAPPCIRMTDPMYVANGTMVGVTSHRSPDAPGFVSASMVTDDGDPLKIGFTWYKGTNGGKLQYVDGVNFQQLYLVPTDYQIGDEVDVRLEVKDQNVGAIDQYLAACGDDDFCAPPISPADGGVCYVRVSWRILLDQDQ